MTDVKALEMKAEKEGVEVESRVTEVEQEVGHEVTVDQDVADQEMIEIEPECFPMESTADVYPSIAASEQAGAEEELTVGDRLDSRSSGRSGYGSSVESADTPVLPALTDSASSSPMNGISQIDNQDVGESVLVPDQLVGMTCEGQEQDLVSTQLEEDLTIGDTLSLPHLADDAATPEPESQNEGPNVDEGEQPLFELSSSNELSTAGIVDTASSGPLDDFLTNPFSSNPKALDTSDPFGFNLGEESGTYPQTTSQALTDPFSCPPPADSTGDKAPEDPLPVSTTLTTDEGAGNLLTFEGDSIF